MIAPGESVQLPAGVLVQSAPVLTPGQHGVALHAFASAVAHAAGVPTTPAAEDPKARAPTFVTRATRTQHCDSASLVPIS